MILYIARHGETDLNIEDRYQGVSNLPLNVRGVRQAASLAEKLPTGIVHVVSSPQTRAYQTAEVIAKTRRLPLTTASRFREKNFGVFEGLSQPEVQARYPELWARGIVQQWDGAPPGGESVHDVVRRVSAGLYALNALHKDDAIALVTHGFVVRAVRFLLTGIRPEEFFTEPRIGNCEFLTFVLN